MNFDSDTNVIGKSLFVACAENRRRYDLKLIQTVRGMGYVLEIPGSDSRWPASHSTVRLTSFYVLASTVLLLGMAAFISTAISRHFAQLDRETLNDKIQLVQYRR